MILKDYSLFEVGYFRGAKVEQKAFLILTDHEGKVLKD